MVELLAFCDEIIRPRKLVDGRQKELNYIIMGTCFVKKVDLDYVYKKLIEARLQFDTKNNQRHLTHLHFSEVQNCPVKKKVSKEWLKLLKSLKDKIKFNILLIDLDKLDLDKFGKEKVDLVIYTRFFRTLLLGGFKYLYKKDSHKIIERVYHEEGSQNKHYYFPYLNLEKLNGDNKTKILDKKIVKNENIVFISKLDNKQPMDSEKYIYSQFIQLTDLILGASTQQLFCLSNNKKKKEVSSEINDILMSLGSKSNWSYYHNIGLFPKVEFEEIKGREDLIKNLSELSLKLDNFNNFLKCNAEGILKDCINNMDTTDYNCKSLMEWC